MSSSYVESSQTQWQTMPTQSGPYGQWSSGYWGPPLGDASHAYGQYPAITQQMPSQPFPYTQYGDPEAAYPGQNMPKYGTTYDPQAWSGHPYQAETNLFPFFPPFFGFPFFGPFFGPFYGPFGRPPFFGRPYRRPFGRPYI